MTIADELRALADSMLAEHLRGQYTTRHEDVRALADRVAELERQVERYQEKADAISRYLKTGNMERAITSVVVELAIDAEQRTAIKQEQADANR